MEAAHVEAPALALREPLREPSERAVRESRQREPSERRVVPLSTTCHPFLLFQCTPTPAAPQVSNQRLSNGSSTALSVQVSNHDELMSNFFAQPDALAYGKVAAVVELREGRSGSSPRSPTR